MVMLKMFKQFNKAQIKNLKIQQMMHRPQKGVNILMKHKTQQKYKKVPPPQTTQQQKQTHRPQ